jgi:hypothetical protein
MKGGVGDLLRRGGVKEKQWGCPRVGSRRGLAPRPGRGSHGAGGGVGVRHGRGSDRGGTTGEPRGADRWAMLQ